MKKKLFAAPPEYKDWREGLDLTTDPAKRIEYMQQGLAEEPTDENKWHMELLKKRYCDKKGRVTNVDNFMAAWVDLEAVPRTLKLLGGKKRGLKLLMDAADRLLLTEDKSQWEDWKKDILQSEYEHLIRQYVTICQDDRMYTGIINGYVKMKDSTIQQKLIDDLNTIIIDIPEALGATEVFQPLRKALDNIM